jgi:hypothetical protein
VKDEWRDEVVRIVWRASTRNHHVGELGDINVVSVIRPQKHRPDGTPYDWRIEILNTRIYDNIFCQFDPRDLDSAKQAAEARAKWAIERLYEALRKKEP